MSQQAKPTPGPWFAHKQQDRTEYNIHGGNDALPVAIVGNDTGNIRGPRGSIETFANATLIAAAPTMLDAIEQARKIKCLQDAEPGSAQYVVLQMLNEAARKAGAA